MVMEPARFGQLALKSKIGTASVLLLFLRANDLALGKSDTPTHFTLACTTSAPQPRCASPNLISSLAIRLGHKVR